MRIDVSFEDGDEQQPKTGSTRFMPLERFVEFLRNGEFGEVVEVKFERNPKAAEAEEGRRTYFFYTVKAEDVETESFTRFLDR